MATTDDVKALNDALDKLEGAITKEHTEVVAELQRIQAGAGGKVDLSGVISRIQALTSQVSGIVDAAPTTDAATPQGGGGASFPGGGSTPTTDTTTPATGGGGVSPGGFAGGTEGQTPGGDQGTVAGPGTGSGGGGEPPTDTGSGGGTPPPFPG